MSFPWARSCWLMVCQSAAGSGTSGKVGSRHVDTAGTDLSYLRASQREALQVFELDYTRPPRAGGRLSSWFSCFPRAVSHAEPKINKNS